MATISQSPSRNKDRYLVLGGCGFVGSHIAQALVDRGETSVNVYARTRPPKRDAIPGVDYYSGDIMDEGNLTDCLKKSGATAVFHTVSPHLGLPDNVHTRINVEGTRLVLRVCREAGVSSFVYTSSTSVVWSGQSVSGLNEDEISRPKKVYEWYAHVKGLAEEIVIQENGHGGMQTVVLRPCGMMGPRVRQAMWRLSEAYKKGQHKYQMGDNTNLVDYSYVGNVADAHILAADKLAEYRTLGLSGTTSSTSSPLISGEVFFISDGCPVPYHTFPRLVYRELGDKSNGADAVILPRWLCIVIAFFTELWARCVTGGVPAFPRFFVDIATREQYYSIDKAKRLLGYEPRVSLEEGVKRMVDWWKERGEKEYIERMNR